jgi:hypothetical protein
MNKIIDTYNLKDRMKQLPNRSSTGSVSIITKIHPVIGRKHFFLFVQKICSKNGKEHEALKDQAPNIEHHIIM